MIPKHTFHTTVGRTHQCRNQATAFSLVELLTVIFIISLLIGILIPSVNSARNAAKRLTTSKTLDSINVGLEMFKNDNGSDFRQTNGYPPSFAHPRIPGCGFNASVGQFPFLPEKPVVYGAHWLPAMLMGVDNLGYVKRSSVPTDLQETPWCWYPRPGMECDMNRPLERMQLYLDRGVKTIPTERLPGHPPEDLDELFPGWDEDSDSKDGMQTLPVIVDAFDQPILYYVASTHGHMSNMLEDVRDPDNDYSGGPQQDGTPFFFHQDNIGFTGDKDKGHPGWNFGNREKYHAIAESGADLYASQIVAPANRETFARYILDRKLYVSLVGNPDRDAVLRPVKADSYLLISAGPDGRYGTNDDVSNLPPWPE
ncbi:MAG: hypothetical protein WBE26_13960 [Phycisphaerae bacterium]